MCYHRRTWWCCCCVAPALSVPMFFLLYTGIQNTANSVVVLFPQVSLEELFPSIKISIYFFFLVFFGLYWYFFFFFNSIVHPYINSSTVCIHYLSLLLFRHLFIPAFIFLFIYFSVHFFVHLFIKKLNYRHVFQGKRVLVVDDVMTAGTAVREAMNLLQNAEAVPAGVVIALDRQV